MDGILTAPLTWGQLSVWRSVEHLPPDRGASANLVWSWDLPAGTTAADVDAALRRLVVRHPVLRTGFVPAPGPRGREQSVLPALETPAERVEAAGDAGPAIEADLARRAFDVTRAPLWRTVVLTRDGRAQRLLLGVHHMAADAAGIDLLGSELLTLLGGGDLDEPVPTCLELAAEQQGPAAAARDAAAVAHWRRCAAAAPPALPAHREKTALRWGVLRSRPGAEALSVLAARVGVSAHTVVLTAFCRTLAAWTGTPRLLLGLIAGNRHDERARRTLGSFNQLVPLAVECDPAAGAAGFAEQARALHWESLRAYRHAAFDCDSLAEVRDTWGYDGSGRGFRYFFNYREEEAAPPGSAGAADPADWTLETRAEGRDNGFPFYFVVSRSGSLTCTLRDSTADTADDAGDRLAEHTGEFLVSFHDLLRELAAAGVPA